MESATVTNHFLIRLDHHNLSDVVHIHNNPPPRDKIKEIALLRIVDCLAPSGVTLKEVEITTEIDTLYLGEIKLTNHPIFQAANLLHKITTYADNEKEKLPALREPFMKLVEPMPNVVSLYLRHRYHLRMLENFESCWALVHALEAVPHSSTLLLAAQRFTKFPNTPYNSYIYEALFKLSHYQVCDILQDRVKYFHRVDMVFERKTFETAKKDCDDLIKREPEETNWRGCAARVELYSWISGMFYLSERLDLFFNCLTHLSEALKKEPSNWVAVSTLLILVNNYKGWNERLDAIISHLSEVTKKDPKYPHKEEVMKIINTYEANKEENSARIERLKVNKVENSTKLKRLKVNKDSTKLKRLKVNKGKAGI